MAKEDKRLQKERDAHQKAFEDAIETASKACAERDKFKEDIDYVRDALCNEKLVSTKRYDKIILLEAERDEARATLLEIQDRHQKTYDDLAAARAEVERLKAIITKNPLMDAIEAERLIECRRKSDALGR